VAETDDDRAEEVFPEAPDLGPVNASWNAAPRSGGLLRRVLAVLERPQLEALRAFNADQVRLDNAFLRFVEQRFAATHRHYDRILGRIGQRQDELDARHRVLERELVSHVQDLARRIDLALLEADRGRPALEHALVELRERVLRLEEALQPKAR
jgi:hypothetical protein